VQVLVEDPSKLDAIRQREMDITKERIAKILATGANVILTTQVRLAVTFSPLFFFLLMSLASFFFYCIFSLLSSLFRKISMLVYFPWLSFFFCFFR
jgi:hypothetical protein